MSALQRAREKLALASGWTDELVSRIARAGKGWLLGPVLVSVALSAGLWSVLHPALAPVIDTNKVPKADREHAIRFLVATFGGVTLLYALVVAAAFILARVRRGSGAPPASAVSTVSALNRYLVPVLAFPFLVQLAQPGIEKTSPKLTLFFVAISAAILGRAAYEWARASGDGEPDPDGPRPHVLRRVLGAIGPVIAVSLWAAYAWFFSRLAITNHHALVTRTIDLGYYDNIFYQSLHGEPLGCSFIKAGNHSSAHFDPILVLLSPLYDLYPRAEMLLVLQSVWLGMGAVPAYLIGKALLKSTGAGVALSMMYCAYPALHGANMYEFHSLSLIAPLVLWLLYFLETASPVRYFFTLAVLLLVREDVPLLLCFVGAYALIVPRAGSARIGRYTLVICLAYFAIVKSFFMQSSGILNAGKDAYSFEYYYDAMIPDRNGIGGLVSSLVTNPLFALKHALEEPKVIFLLLIFLPLGFLPFCARWGRLMLTYGLLFCLLASRGPVFTIHFQYTAILFPLAFALTPIALAQIAEGRFARYAGLDPSRYWRALLAGAFFATMLVSWKFGGIVDNQSFKGGFARIVRTMTDAQHKTYAWVDEQSQAIPEGASVGTTNRLGPHVSNRMWAYFYPARTDVDYLFIDEGELKVADLEKHHKHVAAKAFVEVARHGKLAVFKRKGL